MSDPKTAFTATFRDLVKMAAVGVPGKGDALAPDEMAAAVRVNLALLTIGGGDVGGWIGTFMQLVLRDVAEVCDELQTSLGEAAKVARTLRVLYDALGTVVGTLEAHIVAQMPRASRLNLETGEKEDVFAPFDDDLVDVHVEVDQPAPSWRGWKVPALVAAVCEKMADQEYPDGAAFAAGLRKYLTITGAKAAIKDLGLKRSDFGIYGPPEKSTPKLHIGRAVKNVVQSGPDPDDEGEDE